MSECPSTSVPIFGCSEPPWIGLRRTLRRGLVPVMFTGPNRLQFVLDIGPWRMFTVARNLRSVIVGHCPTPFNELDDMRAKEIVMTHEAQPAGTKSFEHRPAGTAY